MLYSMHGEKGAGMMRFYFESIIILAMFYIARKIWLLWTPNTDGDNDPQAKPEQSDSSGTILSFLNTILGSSLQDSDQEHEQGDKHGDKDTTSKDND